MKIGLLSAALLALHAPTLAADSKTDTQIRKIELDMAAASSADQFVKDFDLRVFAYDMTGNSLKGRDAVRNAYADGFAKLKNVKVEILSMSIESGDTVGFVNSMQHVTADSATGGPAMDVVFRQTDGFRKTGGRWLVVSQHISVPFDPANGRAVFNSR